MATDRAQCICLSVAFLALIAMVAPTQILFELRESDAPGIVELFRQTPSRASFHRLENNLENSCRVGRAIRPWMQCVRLMLLQDAGENAVVGRGGWFFYRPAVRYLIEPWSWRGPQAQGNALDAITSFRDELAQRGIQLLVVPAPNKASIYPEMLTARANGSTGSINPTTREILKELREADIEVVNLFEAYGRAKQDVASSKCYLAQDSHWSPEGMGLAAEAVARRLLDLGWVQRGATEYETRPAPVHRYGDVLKMMQTPQIERFLRPQALNCTQVIDAETAQLYTDDPHAPVLVLGDSFLRIFERDEPGSGGFIAHLAYHLGFSLTSIVSDGGASTLVRQQLSRRPDLLTGKKVVVWEFVERDLRFGTEGWQHVPLPKIVEGSSGRAE